MNTRAVFLDLNGTLVLPVQAAALTDYVPLDGISEAIRLLNEHGFACPVVTVQSRIGKGLYTAEDFGEWFASFAARLARENAPVLGPYVCPHVGKDQCSCRKPGTALYEQAAREHSLAFAHSFVVGDTADDLRAGRALGCRTVLVRTGWGTSSLAEHGAGELADFIAADVRAAAHWILAQSINR